MEGFYDQVLCLADSESTHPASWSKIFISEKKRMELINPSVLNLQKKISTSIKRKNGILGQIARLQHLEFILYAVRKY